MTILDEIIKNKKSEIALRKKIITIDDLKIMPNFKREVPSLSEFLLSEKHCGIIAEYKRKSPSKGIINDHSTVSDVISGYEKARVSAISVLTDLQYFGGTVDDLKEAVKVANVPLLRKDFIVDEFQIYEAKAIGASVILLIAASLSKSEVNKFAMLARELGLEVLFEIHNESELEKISDYINVVGVNNRDLKTFKVDVSQSIHLSSLIPDKYIKISESGISDPSTVKMLKTYGYKGFLMGETFMKEKDPGEACLKFSELIK